MTTTCIAVDSACDLPHQFIDQNNIKILPINLRLGNKLFRDNRDPMRTIQIYNSKRLEKNFNAESEPASVQEITTLIEKDLALQFDNILAITISSKRSDVYRNIRESVFVSSNKFKQARDRQGRTLPLRIRVIDSEALFPGQGLLAYEANRLIKSELQPITTVISQLEAMKSHIRGFLLPESLYYLKNRAKRKGDNSVSWLSYGIGSLLNIKPIIEAYQGETATVDKAKGFSEGLENLFARAKRAIDNGLCIKAINMSYAGNPNCIESLPQYGDFLNYANRHSVTTLLSVMSTTAAVNVGPGAFSLAFAEI
jgi:DegV family protein with EDD domain